MDLSNGEVPAPLFALTGCPFRSPLGHQVVSQQNQSSQIAHVMQAAVRLQQRSDILGFRADGRLGCFCDRNQCRIGDPSRGVKEKHLSHGKVSGETWNLVDRALNHSTPRFFATDRTRLVKPQREKLAEKNRSCELPTQSRTRRQRAASLGVAITTVQKGPACFGETRMLRQRRERKGSPPGNDA